MLRPASQEATIAGTLNRICQTFSRRIVLMDTPLSVLCDSYVVKQIVGHSLYKVNVIPVANYELLKAIQELEGDSQKLTTLIATVDTAVNGKSVYLDVVRLWGLLHDDDFMNHLNMEMIHNWLGQGLIKAAVLQSTIHVELETRNRT